MLLNENIPPRPFVHLTQSLHKQLNMNPTPINVHSLREPDFPEIISRLLHPSKGIKLHPHKYKGTLLTHSFQGKFCFFYFSASSLVQWLHHNIPLHKRRDGVILGQKLLDLGYILSLGANFLEDDDNYFVLRVLFFFLFL